MNVLLTAFILFLDIIVVSTCSAVMEFTNLALANTDSHYNHLYLKSMSLHIDIISTLTSPKLSYSILLLVSVSVFYLNTGIIWKSRRSLSVSDIMG